MPEPRDTFKGYESFDYLEPGVDYAEHDLLDDISPFEPNPVELSDAEEERVEDVMAENVMIAVHEHPIKHPKDMAEVIEYVHDQHVFTHYDGLSRTPLDAIFDGLLHGMEIMESKNGFKWNDVVTDLSMRLADVHHSDLLIQGRSVEDIHRARREGKIGWFPALETATPIENELDRLDMLYGMGLRMLGLTYNEANQLGTGAKEQRDAGLTKLGQGAVDRMNKLGMAIGLSHESHQTIKDVCAISSDPVILSHTAAREVWNTKRAQPDHIFEAIADTGGVIAIEGAHSTRIEEEAGHSNEGMMRHFEYVRDLVGIDHVTFATDTIYGDHESMMVECSELFSVDEIFSLAEDNSDEYKPSPSHTHVIGNENPTEAWNNIPRWLVKHDYSDEEIAKVTGGNTLRVLENIFE